MASHRDLGVVRGQYRWLGIAHQRLVLAREPAQPMNKKAKPTQEDTHADRPPQYPPAPYVMHTLFSTLKPEAKSLKPKD